TLPSVFQDAHLRVPASNSACTFLPSAALRTAPSGPNSLSPFHGAGLWLAVICTPPAASRRRMARPHVGVGATPISDTGQPDGSSPANTAWRNISPLGRPSRLKTIGSPFVCAPSATAKDVAASTVSPSPTIPRIPETLTINVLCPCIPFLQSGTLEVACG